MQATSDRRATFAYVAPFAAYVSLMALDRAANLPAQFFFPLRFVVVGLLLLFVSRPYFSLRPSRPGASVLLGALVFAIWVGPDLLFGYRHFWLFENSLMGKPESSIPAALRHNLPFLTLRASGSFLLVPIVEELFWRGWLMRWLVTQDFMSVKFGTYTPLAFWAVAFVFASEHGSYWEVGLAAGILYNWWAIRTRNIADCMLSHAVTNGILAAYVVLSNQWQYWP